MKNHLIIFLLIRLFAITTAEAQNNMIIQNANVVIQGNYLILNNTNFINSSSTFQSGSGTTIVTGDASTAESQIGGSFPTTFYNLIINKNSNNATLNQNVTINNQLTLTSGKVEINNFNLTISNSGNIAGQNNDRYIVTNGTGSLIRQVGNTWTTFPVGNSTFNPARLKNDGTIDNFSIRMIDNFLQNGTSGSPITTNVIPRTWMIDEATTGGSDVSMRLIWRPSHAGSGFDTNNSQITHYTSSNWQDQTAAASTSDNSYSSDHRYREATNITSFSPFGVKSGASLPVELLYFYGKKEENNVRLDWQTATEINNSHFDVEWSSNGIEFSKIGQVEGTGTTNEITFYDFLHTSPISGLNYYRLKQVDFDKKNEYTNIIQITIKPSSKETIKVFPNPAKDYITIEGIEEGEIAQILNVNGQVVKNFQIQSNNHQIMIDDLSSGTYFVKIRQEVKKIIVQK